MWGVDFHRLISGSRSRNIDRGIQIRAAQPPPVQIECVFYGPLRDPVGEKTVYRNLNDGATVGDLLADLEAAYPDLDLLEDGERREHLTITVDGKDVRHLEGDRHGTRRRDARQGDGRGLWRLIRGFRPPWPILPFFMTVRCHRRLPTSKAGIVHYR